MKNRFAGMVAACSMLALMTGAANALELAWVHANAAAQSEARVKAGFDAPAERAARPTGTSACWTAAARARRRPPISQDAASRGVDAIGIKADLRASRAALDAARAAKIPVFAVDSGYTDGKGRM